MKDAYTVAVSSGTTLTCSQRIELEVRFARELERILGGEEAIVAALQAERAGVQPAPKSQRLAQAVQLACLDARNIAPLNADVAFAVRLQAVHAAVGAAEGR